MLSNRRILTTAMVLLLLLLVIGFNVALYLLYQRSVDALERGLGDRLLSVGRALAPLVEQEVGKSNVEGELTLVSLVLLQDYFEQVSERDDLSAIYLLNQEGEDMLAWEDSLSEVEILLPLHRYELAQAQIGQAVTSELYEVDDRNFKAAYQPVGENPVQAVLIIESSFTLFSALEEFERSIILVNSIALAVLLVIGGAILLLNRRLITTEKLLVSQAALSQMGQMAAIIAHEVRNPLAIIKAAAERIKKRFGKIEGGDSSLLDYIPEEIDRLNQITTHYLQFAAPADAPAKLESAADTVRMVVEATQREAKRHSIDLSSSIEPGTDEVLADATALRQIVINLLRNAIDAVGDSGKIEVTITKISRRNAIRLVVADNGSGISKKEQKRIFDPFFTTKVSGTGLGLFVVKRLVDKIGGTVDIESQEGRGTKFVIIFEGIRS